MRIRTQPLFDNYNKYGYIESTYIAIAKPGKRLLGVLNGVDESSCRLEINLNNTAVLTFDVKKMVDGNVSSYYNRIEQLMELELPSVGWFKINEEPTISDDGSGEIMSVRAESLEIELAQYFIKGMEINMGSVSSAEMLATDNTYDADDGTDSKFAWTNVKFYRDTTQLQELIALAQPSWTKQDLINRLNDYPCLYNSWRITYNLGSVNNAITSCAAAVTDEERSRVIASYENRIKSQQSIYFLTQSYPELLPYLEVADIDLSKPPIRDENGNITDDDSGLYTIPEMLNIELKREKELSMLDLVLDGTGWTVGFVDNSVVSDSDEEDDTIPLNEKVGTFEISSSNVYNFLMQEACPYFRCIFVFDTINKTVNCYNVNNLGVDTNIFINFANIQNSVERTNDDQIKTVFHVNGGDNLDIAYANLGYDSIMDLSYYMNTDHFDQATIDKYNHWVEHREELRQQFMDLSVQYYDKLEEISYIEDRVPVDGTDPSQYTSFTDKELVEERAKYEAILRGIKSYYVDENNDFSISALMTNQEDYAEYLYITKTILSNPLNAYQLVYFDPVTGEYEVPDGGTLGQIDLVLLNRAIANGDFVDESDSAAVKQQKTDYKRQKEYLDNYQYDFETYGIGYGLNEIQVRIDDLRNKSTTLWSRGYNIDPDNVPEDEEDPEQFDDDYHRQKYELYEKYQTALAQAEVVLAERQQESTTARNELKQIADQMTELTEQSEISHEQYGFTQDELDLLKAYYVHTDYVNENLIVTDIDTSQEIVNTENKLYKYAQEELYAASHPQYRWSTSQSNLFLMPEFKSWHNQLDIGNYITIGMEPKPTDSNERNNINYLTKLRVVQIGLNPFMIEPDIDITFSSNIQYKSRQNDFVDLFELNNGVGDSQISAYSNSKHLDGSYSIDSSFLVKLLQGGMKTYIQNSSADSVMESYQNFGGAGVKANDWVINTGANGIDIMRSWTIQDEQNDTTINGGSIVTNGIYAKHLMVNQIASSNYVPDNNSNFSTSGSYWNLLNGNYVSPGFSIINVDNGENGEHDWESHAYFRGDITANTGYIGGASGWVIATNKIYSGTVDGGTSSGDITLSTSDFVRTIDGIPRSYLRFAIGNNFGVSSNGTLYASNANLSGQLYATSGNYTSRLDSNGFQIHDDYHSTPLAEFTFDDNSGGGQSGILRFYGVQSNTPVVVLSADSLWMCNVDQPNDATFRVDSENGNMLLSNRFTAHEVSCYAIDCTQLDATQCDFGSLYVRNAATFLDNLTTYGTGTFGAVGVTTSITCQTITTSSEIICGAAISPQHQTIDPNCYITSDGKIHKTAKTSSIRYKNIYGHLSNNDVEKLYEIPIYWFKYKEDYISKDDERYDVEMPGFVVEDLEKYIPVAVDHLDGKPEKWNSLIIIPIMFQMIKNEHERNDKLQSEINELKTMIKQLTER